MEAKENAVAIKLGVNGGYFQKFFEEASKNPNKGKAVSTTSNLNLVTYFDPTGVELQEVTAQLEALGLEYTLVEKQA